MYHCAGCIPSVSLMMNGCNFAANKLVCLCGDHVMYNMLPSMVCWVRERRGGGRLVTPNSYLISIRREWHRKGVWRGSSPGITNFIFPSLGWAYFFFFYVGEERHNKLRVRPGGKRTVLKWASNQKFRINRLY